MRIAVNIEPLPQPRPRFGQGRAYEPSKVKLYKAAIAAAAQAAMKGQPPTPNAVAVNLKFYRKFNPASRRFGDADNLAKGVFDALTGITWVDDAQIIATTIEKQQSPSPRLEIEITDA